MFLLFLFFFLSLLEILEVLEFLEILELLELLVLTEESVDIKREADAPCGARCHRRAVVVCIRLIVEEVIDCGIDVYAAGYVLLKHQLPDCVALVHIGAT